MVKISVIMPVYNVEDYLDETLESLVCQTMIDDIEVLMIDDGSTDESRYIIEKYALDYDNFHAFHKENQGQGATRNYGMSLAKGDYIHFMDSDDYLPPDAYEKLYLMAERNNFENDFILGNVLRFRRYNAWDSLLFKNCFLEIDEDLDSTTLDGTPSIVWDTITCNKLYKKEFLEENNITFIEDKTYYEDILFSFESYIRADSIAIIRDVIYYWRVRREKSSTTQQINTTKNFRDRLKILNLCLDLIYEHNVSQQILHRQYSKWLANDFKAHLRKVDEFPREEIGELVEELNNFLAPIPSEIRDCASSFSKVLFEMVENRDIDGIINFAGLEKDLKLNPVIPDNLDEKYVEYIDFKHDGLKEDLIAEVFEVSNDDDNIFLEFTERINFISADTPHESEAYLIDGENLHPLEIRQSENRTIVLPADLIRDKNHFNIKMIYRTENHEWESVLRNKRRHSIRFEDFDADIGIGYNHLLYADIRERTNNMVEITEISFENNEFEVTATSQKRISRIMIQNVLSFEKIIYDVEYLTDGEFTFTIPYRDIMNGVVKKWEINCCDCLNSICLSKKFKFFTKISKITFTNTRNKILITEDIANAADELSELTEKHVDLKKKHKKLKRQNLKLNKKINKLDDKIDSLNSKIDDLNGHIDEFKSRKVVRFADKMKFR